MNNIRSGLYELKSIVGAENVLPYNESDEHPVEKDYFDTQNPLAVIVPNNADEISNIMKFCYANNLKITIRGGGSSVNGGVMSCGSDIILSLEKLNNIIEINEFERIAVVETGVVTEVLQKEVEKYGLSFPQNISSAGMSFIGGNIAIRSGSPKSFKYGTTANYILNLEVVLPNGEIIWTGKNVKKDSSGYNLTQLFTGSEGTLGIITKAVIKLIPLKKEWLFFIPFSSVSLLYDFIKEVLTLGLNPSSIEFLDAKGFDLVCSYLKDTRMKLDAGSFLWIEFETEVWQSDLPELEIINQLIFKYSDYDVLFAESSRERENLWKYRNKIGESCMDYCEFVDYDFSIPFSVSQEVYEKITTILDEFNFEGIIVGHIGDGNFHINVFRNRNLSSEDWNLKINQCFMKINSVIVGFGGSVPGEHGVGYLNKKYFNLSVGETQIGIMKEIKKIFDPQGILNFDKIF
ncbi:FAD-binding oxidoreductase [Chryseobacterium antibioticum]|uniref:FAD-binding oxidoreductase n=1 Tax=Chryseobacterium pyrolae TaxID=2987481 RepID=A0ABT2ID95_9FLAO|nr:FAD-binding oxidoreductase [Chryseobacterium pyrolae]MCT2406600.1 FAD-binding oxidoreductase [Chryseobacterium pyrolae]